MGDGQDPLDECPLSAAEQTRNVLVVGINTALCYLAAPVLYVDVLHTSLLNKLQLEAGRNPPSDTLSNLPASGYLAFSVLPLFIAWAFPQIALLRRILVLCYLTLTLGSALMLAVLLLPVPWWVQAVAAIMHGAVVGGARTVAVAIEFEVLGIAVSVRRRGQALGLAYGLGPILAVAGSLISQLLLTGAVGPLVTRALPVPINFAAVFAVSVPVMGLAAYLCSRLIVPVPKYEAPREPFLAGVFGGFGRFLGRPVVLLTVITMILIMAGYQVIGNFTLYTKVAFGQDPSETAGYQKAVLFTCKVLMGVSMGWALTWAAPRSAVLISALAGLASVTFAIFAPASWFLVSFGCLGAGQLYGIYSTNYVLSCAPKALMRRYMAFTMITMLPAAPAGAIYGLISDYFGNQYKASFPGRWELGALLGPMGTDYIASLYGKAVGFRLSFSAAAALIALGIVLSLLLPARPMAQEATTVQQ